MASTGWFAIDNHLVETAPASVGCVAWTVYTILARHADADGRCWPSVPRIADMAGVTPRAARNALRILESKPLISTTQRRDESGRNTSSIYKLTTLSPREQAEPNDRGPGTKRQGKGEQSASIHPERNDRGTRNEAPVEEDPIEEDSIEQHPVKNKRRAAKAAVAVEIPSAIDTEAFRAAWGEWLRYLAHDKKKPAGATVQGRQLKKLAAWGETKAIMVIDHCITNNWQGLFEPKENANDRHINRNAGPGARFKTAGYGTPGVF